MFNNYVLAREVIMSWFGKLGAWIGEAAPKLMNNYALVRDMSMRWFGPFAHELARRRPNCKKLYARSLIA
jgi:hypothetical protein